jgi:co-chaperonin GroES (HSP10)
MPQMNMVHDDDPKEKILKELGDLSGVEVMFSHVLVAIYRRPAKTSGGVFMPDQYLDEDIYQGKAMLVVKKGPLAFKDTEEANFYGADVKVGDWIVCRPSDGWAVSVNKVQCRMLRDVAIKMVVSRPDIVW